MNSENRGHFINEAVEVTTVHSNLSQEIVKITVDKLKLILHTHLAAMERRRDWLAPLGVFITLIVVFPTTDFKDNWLEAATWQAIFIISSVLTFFWLVKTVVTAWCSPTIESVIDRIKKGE